MRIQSRGLGKRELLMDLHEFKAIRDGDEVILKGVTHAPVSWETNIRISAEDIGGLFRVALSTQMLRLLVRWSTRKKTNFKSGGEVKWEHRSGPKTLKDMQGSRANNLSDPSAVRPDQNFTPDSFEKVIT